MRVHSLLSCLVVVVLTVLLSGCLNTLPPGSNPDPKPPENSQKGSLTGLVQDANSGLGLWNGQVTIGGQSTSIKGGAFEVKNITPGNHTLTIHKLFYQPLQKQVVITNSNVSITEKLTPAFGSGDLDLFARLVYAEAKGEVYQGQVAVAATVLNRVAHPDYPNTLSGVINQVIVSGGKKYYQYEPVLNGSIKIPASQTAKDAVADALAGWDPSLSATGFFAPAKVGPSSWVWSRTSTITIGNHRFFR